MTLRTLAAAGAALFLAACATGPRPTLTDERQIDDSAVEAVLDRLSAAQDAAFTAVYTITPTATGSTPSTATVTHSPTETMVVFAEGDVVTVEYVTVDGEARTCAANQTECVTGSLDETRISNLAVTSSFWGPSAAQKLRTDASRNVADATSRTAQVADQPATCADVPVGTTTVIAIEYCALDAGPLATYRGADTVVELTSYTAG